MAPEAHPDSWHSHTFRAMGSEMALWLETADAESAAGAFAAVEALFAANEQALSRFRPSSELSRLNDRSGQWVVVSDLLWEVLDAALALAAATHGRFDPTTLNALENAGYAVSFEQLASAGARRNGVRPRVAPLAGQWAGVQRNAARQAVRLPGGVRLDLGGIAKGYTAQQAVARLRPWGPCLVDAGGDLVAGAAPAGHSGWPVAVSAPWQGDDSASTDLFTLWLADAALATSGIDYRTWTQHNRRAHHLIDPATGQPAVTDALTVTVLAENAATAEAWATATLVAGVAAGSDALLDAGLAGLIVRRDGRILVTPPMRPFLQMASPN